MTAVYRFPFFMLVNQKKFGEWALTPWNSHQWIARLLFSSFCLMTHSEPLLCCTQDRQRQWKAKAKWVGETLSLVIVFIFPRSRPLPQLLASRGSGLPGGIGDFILSIEQVVIFCAALPLFNEVSAKIHQLGITSHFTVNAAAVARKCSRCGKKDLSFFFPTCVTCAMLPWCQTSRPQSASVTYTVAEKTWSYQLGWIQS